MQSYGLHCFDFQRPCVCPYQGCQKTFVRALHLKRHLLSHDGEKIFKSVTLAFTIYYFGSVYFTKKSRFSWLLLFRVALFKRWMLVATLLMSESCFCSHGFKSLIWVLIAFLSTLSPGSCPWQCLWGAILKNGEDPWNECLKEVVSCQELVLYFDLNIRCSQCDMLFMTKHNSKRHEQRAHNRPFKVSYHLNVFFQMCGRYSHVHVI